MDSHALVWPLELAIWTPTLQCGSLWCLLWIRSFLSFLEPFAIITPHPTYVHACPDTLTHIPTSMQQLVNRVDLCGRSFRALCLWCSYVWAQGVAGSLKRLSGAKTFLG